MAATFQSLRETRLPNALKQLQLLGNLARYQHTPREAAGLLREVAQGYADLCKAFDAPAKQVAPTPLLDEIAAQASAEATPAPGDIANRQHPPQWATVRDMARKAALSDLHAAMLIYMDRIETELGKAGQ